MPDEGSVGDFIDNIARKKRSIVDKDDITINRKELFSLSPEEREKFEAALKWMITTRAEGDTGLTNYEIFVRIHRMSIYPEAYSKEDDFHYHSKFLRRYVTSF